MLCESKATLPTYDQQCWSNTLITQNIMHFESTQILLEPGEIQPNSLGLLPHEICVASKHIGNILENQCAGSYLSPKKVDDFVFKKSMLPTPLFCCMASHMCVQCILSDYHYLIWF